MAATKKVKALKWVDPGTSRVVVTNAFRRKKWPAQKLAHDVPTIFMFSVVLPGSLPVSFVATSDGVRFFAREEGTDEACLAAAQGVPDSAFAKPGQSMSYDVVRPGKLAVFPGGKNGDALGPVLATAPGRGLHTVTISKPIVTADAKLAWVIRLQHY